MLEKNIIMISRDPLIMDSLSEVRGRIESYGDIFSELHVLVVGGEGCSSEVVKAGNKKNVYLYYIGKSSVWSLIKAYLKVKQIIKSKEKDKFVITTQDPFETGLVGWFIKKKFAIGWQAQVHTDFGSSFFKKESLKNRARVWLASFILPTADSIRVVSERIKKYIIDRYGIESRKIRVVPIRVEIDKSEGKVLDVDKKKFVILMASRLTREKNIEMAIKALEGVVRNFSDVLLIIAGDGPYRGKLERLVTDLDLGDYVKFEGWQSDLGGYFRRADLYLLTSLYEGYGRTVIEAIKYGVPVVMTEVGVAGEIIKDKESGRVVPVFNRIVLERALIDLIKDRSLREEYSKRALVSLDKYESGDYLEKIKESLDI